MSDGEWDLAEVGAAINCTYVHAFYLSIYPNVVSFYKM